jgi:protease II
LVKKNQKIYFNQFFKHTTEFYLLADNPDGEFKVFQKRKRGLEYSISHFAFTNKDKAINFKLMKTLESKLQWIMGRCSCS